MATLDSEGLEKAATAMFVEDAKGGRMTTQRLARAAVTAYLRHTQPVVTTLHGLPSGTVIQDRHDDIGTILAGRIHYPETAPMDLERASKKYGPFTVLHRGSLARS